MPSVPTLYDYLLLALRKKDVIATFNWDPFLSLAAKRCAIPDHLQCSLLFLHGNVQIGYCPIDNEHGYKGNQCSKCGNLFKPSPLLYPTAQKDYESDPMIVNAWNQLEDALSKAFMVTVFGYSAPTSDAAAVDILRKAWDSNKLWSFGQFEIINTQNERDLKCSWDPFIHTHHYEVHEDYYDSWLAMHPRRTAEAFGNQILDGKFVKPNKVPEELSFPGLSDWFKPLLEAEGILLDVW